MSTRTDEHVRRHQGAAARKALNSVRLRDQDLELFKYLYKNRVANFGNLRDANIWKGTGVFRRVKQLVEAGYLEDTRYSHPELVPYETRSGKTLYETKHQDYHAITLAAPAIRILQSTGEDEYHSTTSANERARRRSWRNTGGQLDYFRHACKTLEAVQTLTRQNTNPNITYEVGQTEWELRDEAALLAGKKGFFDYAGDTKVTPDYTVVRADKAIGKRTLLALEFDAGYYGPKKIQEKLRIVEGDDYWQNKAATYDDFKLVFLGYSDAVRNRDHRYAEQVAGGENGVARTRCEFYSLNDLKTGALPGEGQAVQLPPAKTDVDGGEW